MHDPYSASPRRYEEMVFRRVGRSGLRLPVLSLGLWHNFGDRHNQENMRALLRCAFDRGVTHFDLANNYGPPPGAAEEHFGRLFAQDFKPYRDELIISSKAGYTMWPGPYGDGGSRKYLISSLDQSLRRMGLDYVDLFYHHRPDPDTEIEETVLALKQIVTSGKALYIGLSNYEPDDLSRAAALLREEKVPFVICQNSHSVFNRKIDDNGFKRRCADLGLGMIAYSPLDQGILTERYLHGIPDDARIHTDGRFLRETDLEDDKMKKVRALHQLAQKEGLSLAVLSLLFVLRDTWMASVLVGASKCEQLEDNLGILSALPRAAELSEKIEALLSSF